MSRLKLLEQLRGRCERSAATYCCRRPLRLRGQRAVVSFTFDDFPHSALAAGGRILADAGVAGTYYASLGLMHHDSPTGRLFSAEDVPELLSQGHELGCHTYDHRHAWHTPSRAFERSVLQNRHALDQLVPGAVFRTFSYPIAAPWPPNKAKVARYFTCCRGGGQRSNTGVADLNQLSAFFLERARGQIDVVRNLIHCNRAVGGWLIFATHDVTEHPTSFGCTPGFFREVVHQTLASGALVLSITAAVTHFRTQ